MRENSKILIVDDNTSILTSLYQLLKHEFEQVSTLSNPEIMIEQMKKTPFDIILLDMNFKAGVNTGNEGFFWFQKIRNVDPEVVVIFITAYADVSIAVNAIKKGVFDYIIKPWNPHDLINKLKKAHEYRLASIKMKQLEEKEKYYEALSGGLRYPFIGSSKEIIAVKRMIQKVSQTDTNILITGENGTGKEIVAREIHRLSLRAKRAFIHVDMGTINEQLIESELFGHVKGAFTDAREDRIGRIELANGGTLFLDEIANLNFKSQAKILSFLQNRWIQRIGSNRDIKLDIRVVAATNRNLKEMVSSGLFREDLYYRLNTINIHLPPLSSRGSDIEDLCLYYLEKFSSQYKKKELKLSGESMEKIKAYHWPGNIRELKHAVEKAVILAESNVLKASDFPLMDESYPECRSLRLGDIEKTAIMKALKNTDGNLSKASKLLDISRTTLYSKMKKHDL